MSYRFMVYKQEIVLTFCERNVELYACGILQFVDIRLFFFNMVQ